MANSWKKYGGIYKSDKYNSIGVGTMVADQVLIRQRVITSSQIAGSLYVGENMNIENDIDIGNNAKIGGNVDIANNTNIDGGLIVLDQSHLNKDAYIGEKLYFNDYDNKDTDNNYVAYVTGNSKTGKIGIGTMTPRTFLDINVSNSELNSGQGDSIVGDTITDVLTVRNSNNRIRNIIAQNVHNSGVVVDTSGDIASIEFYQGDISDNTALTPLKIVANTSKELLTLHSKDNYIVSTNDSKINTENNLIITTSNITNINSIATISKRTSNEQLLNGTITVYDNSASVFLYDYYKEPSANSGNAITVVSEDASSNAFVNIVTPNNNGLSIGGGAYPRDKNRTMGTIGILQSDISYIPTQVIVSNNDPIKYKTSMGINTYCPESNKYVMDINGPTRIGNGEIHHSYTASFQGTFAKFLKQGQQKRLFGTLAGTPYASQLIDSEVQYSYNIITTIDGGTTWNIVDLSNNVFSTSQTYDTISSFPIDDTNIFIISSTAKLGHVNTSTNKTIATEYNNPPTEFNTLYVLQTDTTYKLLIGGSLTNGNGVKTSVYYYYEVDKTGVIFESDRTTPTNSIDAHCSDIKGSDGIDDIIFVVGNGIEKINYANSIPLSVSYKNDGSYNSVSVYDADYIVATGASNGNSVISYTYDGGNTWNNADTSAFSVNHSYPGFNENEEYTSFSIKSMDLFDEYRGFATGIITDASGEHVLFIYTTDRSKTWNRVNPKTFYSSGLGHLLEHTTVNSIHMTNDNEIVVIDTIGQGIQQTSTIPFYSGKSSILRCFFPNIFNTYSNQVVDVNGGMNVDGKIIQF